MLAVAIWNEPFIQKCCAPRDRPLNKPGTLLSSAQNLWIELKCYSSFSAQSESFPHLRVNASQTSVGACQLRSSCRRFLQQISWHFQLTAVASTRVFRSHQKWSELVFLQRTAVMFLDRLRKWCTWILPLPVGGNYQVTGWQAARGAWMVSPRSSCMSDSGGSTLLSLTWKPAALFVCTPALLFYVPFFFNSQNLHFLNGYKVI